MAGSYWYGPSVSSGYRTRALGPRPLSGGPSNWPSNATPGGGWGNVFAAMGKICRCVEDPSCCATGDADGAPGWGTPFDASFGVPVQPINSVRAIPRADQLNGLGDAQGQARPWESTLTPTVQPWFVMNQTAPGLVKNNNAPFYRQNFREVPQRKWPVSPNRGSFEGPYGAHALPFYARMMRTPTSAGVPGWPNMRQSPTGIASQFIANVSRYNQPSRHYIHAQRSFYTPKFAMPVNSSWPGAQAPIGKGYFQEPSRPTQAPTVGTRVIR